MHFSCLKEQLDQALRFCAKATARQSTLPIAQNISLEAHDGILRCRATNLDVGIVVQLGGKVEKNGHVVIPPHLLQSFVGAVDMQARIDCVVGEDGSLTVRSGSQSAKIKGFDVTDFPIIPSKDDVKRVAIFDAAVFISGLQRVIGSVAKSEARPELTGVAILHNGQEAIFVATDGFRLAESRVPVAQWHGEEFETPVIIPASAVDEVLYVVSDLGSKKVTVSYGDGQVFFECDDVVIVSRLITGTYPDYTQIIPNETVTTVEVDRVQCEKAVRLAEAFATRATSDMSLVISPEDSIFRIGAASHDRGTNETALDAIVVGDAQTVYLNTRYMLDGVVRCVTPRVRLRFAAPTAPIVIEPVMPEGVIRFLYLIMPIRR